MRHGAKMKRCKVGKSLGLGMPLAAALAGMTACRSAQVAPPVAAPAAASPAAPPAALPAPEPAPPLASPGPGTEARGERPHNTLRWKTNDLSNYGYDVYRAESEAGPFVRVTARPVPGTLKPGKVQTFEYHDEAIDPSRDYWYYVESISLTGERTKFTPTLKAPAKVPPPTPRD